MKQISMLNDFKSKAAAVGLGAVIAFGGVSAPHSADAQSAQQQSAQQVMRVSNSSLTRVYGTSLDAGGDAAEFSSQQNSIGVVVYYGAGIDPISYGDAFAQGLARRGINARSFAAPVGGNGVKVLYQIGPSGIGPLDINDPDANRANMQRAVSLSQARDRMLYSSYTPPTNGG